MQRKTKQEIEQLNKELSDQNIRWIDKVNELKKVIETKNKEIETLRSQNSNLRDLNLAVVRLVCGVADASKSLTQIL